MRTDQSLGLILLSREHTVADKHKESSDGPYETAHYAYQLLANWVHKKVHLAGDEPHEHQSPAENPDPDPKSPRHYMPSSTGAACDLRVHRFPPVKLKDL